MRLEEIVAFREDLLFQGAVQLGWFERNKALSDKAAGHFIFHGPDYHGVVDKHRTGLKLVDTASFTTKVLKRLFYPDPKGSFELAIAGYGTGKSHLAVTLATLLSEPESILTQKIIGNLSLADKGIAAEVKNLLSSLGGQPYLVVALNGMEDFNLGTEISRCVFTVLRKRNLNVDFLQKLRPRFGQAKNFVKLVQGSLDEEFRGEFGEDYSVEAIFQGLDNLDEQVFQGVSNIHAKNKPGESFTPASNESLQDFLRATKEEFCGPRKPFAGILIIFDEFGRYLEFAMQKPYIAGPDALQQLYEAVQENSEGIFLLAFIQAELSAYVARVAPERREDLSRFTSRFDTLSKARLSINLETIIANLIEKKLPDIITRHVEAARSAHNLLLKWFPEAKNYPIWSAETSFSKVIQEGCWPFHPLLIWSANKLTAIGRTFQQRSVLSFLMEAFETCKNMQLAIGETLSPIQLLTDNLIEEFLNFERIGSAHPVAHAYLDVIEKYRNQLNGQELSVLKAVLLSHKIGLKVEDVKEYSIAISTFCGFDPTDVDNILSIFEKEHGVIGWNALSLQFDIVADGVSRKSFEAMINKKINEISLDRRAEIFSTSCQTWLGRKEYSTDFAAEANTCTKEWNYDIAFTDINSLKIRIDIALTAWQAAVDVNVNKGQLIYCYVGPNSDLNMIKEQAAPNFISHYMNNLQLDQSLGAPLAIILLNDVDGSLGEKLAIYWSLEHLTEEKVNKYVKFTGEKKSTVLQELEMRFQQLEKEHNIVFAAEVELKKYRLKQMLELLFKKVYPKLLPFPFDGFGTARGNAAIDSRDFTRELLLGNLDHDWLKSKGAQVKNRGYQVLVDSWQIFDLDGTVQLLPANKYVREAMELLEGAPCGSVNLGDIARKWINPPYGLNIAIVGLLIAIFIGPRSDLLEIVFNGRIVKHLDWLDDVMPKNFMELPKLAATEIQKIDKSRVNRWEVLLNKWQMESTYSGLVDYQEKALMLENEVPIPASLKYKRQTLLQNSDEAHKRMVRQRNLKSKTHAAIVSVIDTGDAEVLASAGAEAKKELDSMMLEKEKWTSEQVEDIEVILTEARINLQRIFEAWLKKQQVASLEKLEGFKNRMLKVKADLKILNCDKEAELLVEHVAFIERNTQYYAELKESVKNTENHVSGYSQKSMTLLDLQIWLKEAYDYKAKLIAAKEATRISPLGIENTLNNLERAITSCKQKIYSYRAKAASIYDPRRIVDKADLNQWQSEVAELMNIYSGSEKDISDFKAVVRQLDLLNKHFDSLADTALTEQDFKEKLATYEKIAANYFGEDKPPLDNAPIYQDIKTSIDKTRSEKALEWLAMVQPKIDKVKEADASYIVNIKKQIESYPAVLNYEQQRTIDLAIEECETRLDQMEVESLIAKFTALSKGNRIYFLKELITYLEKHFPSVILKIPQDM